MRARSRNEGPTTMRRVHYTNARGTRAPVAIPKLTTDGFRIFEDVDCSEDMAEAFKEWFDSQSIGCDLGYRRTGIHNYHAFFARPDDNWFMQISPSAMSVKIHEFLATSFVWSRRAAKRLHPKKSTVAAVRWALEMQLLHADQKPRQH